MKCKRILSGLLAVCMLLALMPALSLPAKAADAVSYVRYDGPEVAIFNKHSGNNSTFYKSMLKNKKYNAVEAGKFGSLRYDTSNGKTTTFTWSNFASTQLAFFSDQTQELKVNYSTTLKNNFHKHSWGFLGWYSQKCSGRMNAQLVFPGNKNQEGTWYAAQYYDGSSNETVRKGNMSYANMPYVFNGNKCSIATINGNYIWDWKRSDLRLDFQNVDYRYDSGNKTCTCGGWASGNFVGFYDEESPRVTAVETRRNGVATTDFKPGDTIQVVLQFSEPIRFSDDTATGKDNIYIGLLVNGSASDPLWARLTSLENSGYYSYNPNTMEYTRAVWELTFEYQVSDKLNKLTNITGLVLNRAPEGGKALVLSEATAPLKQLQGNTAFDVDPPSDKDVEGFTKAKSYVTDMAGNAMIGQCPGVNFTVDPEQPYVAKVVVNATTNNENVKTLLGEDEAISDTYLGVLDSFTLTVYMNELVNLTSTETAAVVTLNLLDENDAPVTVPLQWSGSASAKEAGGTQYGLGASGGKVSVLKSSSRVWIEEGYHLPDGQNTLTVTGISYVPEMNVCDASLNTARDDGGNLHPSMSYHLDTVGPAVEVEAAVQDGVNEEAYVPFTVTDGTGGSGVAGMVGSVVLRCSGEASAFEYAVTGFTASPAADKWAEAHFGEEFSFVQTSGRQYLHLRPVKNQAYDFAGLTGVFTLSDYAGNTASRTETMTNLAFDTVKPVLSSGSAERTYDNLNHQGVMTVPVTARDAGGLKSLAYLWAEADAEISEDAEGWTDLAFAETDGLAEAEVTVTLSDGGTFGQTLWLKAEDQAGNRAMEKKNAYSYNLMALVYDLDYTTGVTTEADIRFGSMDQDEGVLVVDLHKKGDDVHYINVGMSGGFNNGAGNITQGSISWYLADLDESETEGRTFTILPDQGNGSKLLDYLAYYSGEIEVTVYSGTLQSIPVEYKNNPYGDGYRWNYTAQTDPIVMDNSVDVEKFTLRVVQANDSYVQNADAARIQCEFTDVDPRLHHTAGIDAGTVDSSAPDAFDDYGLNRSLAGLTVSFRLTDTYGWDFDDIDWSSSYFRLNTHLGQQMQSGEGTEGVQTVCGIGSGPVQTVTFPATEIPSGEYSNMTLFIMRYSCPENPYQFYVNLPGDEELAVEIDATAPGRLEPGMLSFQPYTKFFNYDIEDNDTLVGDGLALISMEMSEGDFPRQLIEYDAKDVIFVPAGPGRVDMMFRVLDADGDPAPRLGYVSNYVRNYGQYDVVAWNTADPDTLTWLQSDSSSNVGYGGYYTYGYSEDFCFRYNEYGRLDRWTNAGASGELCLSFTMGDRNTVYDTYAGYSRQLRLTPDQDNVIALQARYVNGGVSDVVYLTIHPVSPAVLSGVVTVEPEQTEEDPYHPWGTIVGAPGEVLFRYTPAAGELTSGQTFYLCEGFSAFIDSVSGVTHTAVESGVSWVETLGVTNPVEMSLQADGSYLAAVPKQFDYYNDLGGLKHYVVAAVDDMGNLTVLPGPENSVVLDYNGPVIDFDPETEVTDGRYTAEFYVQDETLMACVSTQTDSLGQVGRPVSAPMELTFSVDEAYAELIGADQLTLVYDPAEAFENGTVTAEDGNMTIVSELPVEGNSLGIESITATLTLECGTTLAFAMNQYAMLTLTVNGWISPKLDTPADVELTLSAVDRYGHNVATFYNYMDGELDENDTDSVPSEGSTLMPGAVGVKPSLVSAEYRLTESTPGFSGDRALYLTFSAPVQPAPSWICPEPQGYARTWHDAFPVWNDGEWEISYYDLSGTLCTETITLTDVFGEYGVDLNVGETELTTEPFTIRAVEDGRDPMNLQALPDSDSGYLDEQSDREVSLEITGNGDYILLRYPGEVGYNYWASSEYDRNEADVLIIHVTNLVTGRPEETVTLFFHDEMEGYTAGAADQRRGTTDSPVTVSYRTKRDTQPVDGETSKTFHFGDDDSYSFTYIDPVTEQKYTISGSLGALGVTLIEPVTPPADVTPPDITRVTVWRQMGGHFEQAETFRGDEEESAVAAVFGEERTGYVSAYSLVLSVDDASPWKLLLCDAAPSAPSYDDGNAAVAGVTLQGNNVLITPEIAPDAFWIAAVDSAGNFTSLRILKSWLLFDTTAPTIVASNAVAASMGERVYYLSASDDHTLAEYCSFRGAGVEKNDGSNGDYPVSDWPYLIRFTQNVGGEGVPVTVTDLAGNSTIRYFTMEGIDNEAPILTVTWSPCFRDASGFDHASAPMDLKNVTVVAHVTSSKSIAGAWGSWVTTSPDAPGWREEAALEEDPQGFFGPIPNVYYTLTDAMINVLFTDSCIWGLDTDGDGNTDLDWAPAAYEVDLHVLAPNGMEEETTLNLGAGIVDIYAPFEGYDYAPEVYETIRPYLRDGFSTPYAEEHVLFDPIDDVYCMNSGKAGVLYNAANPFVVTFTDDEPQVLRFADKAGNVNTITVSPTGAVDSRAPVLSVEAPDSADATGTPVTVTVTTDEECTLSCEDSAVTCSVMTRGADEAGGEIWTGTVTVEKNGTYRLSAADKAGNVSRATFTINNIDRTLPTIRFEASTVSLRQNSSETALTALLNAGILLWDNVGLRTETLSIDASAVDLSVPGVYGVVYTVKDTAGNTAQATRLVRVIDANRISVSLDGALTEPDGITTLKTGAHVLTVAGLKTEGNASEPYKLKLARGILSDGQMKRIPGFTELDDAGSFTISIPGFYTLYITTQSRQTYRTLIYVEN